MLALELERGVSEPAGAAIVLRMSHTSRRRLPGFALVAAAALLTACGNDGAANPSEDPPDPSEDLQMADGVEVDMDGGGQVRVHSPDKQQVWVQFSSEGDDWTDPELVHEESGRWTHDVAVDTAGSTVGISIDYWQERELEDDIIAESTVNVICHEQACEEAVSTDGLSSIQLSADGTAAWSILDADTLTGWTPDTGQRQVSLPDEDFSAMGAWAVLADGTAVAVTGEEDGGTCRITLHTASPGDDELSEVADTEASFTDPLPSQDECGVGGLDHGKDEVTVDGTDVTFSRESGEWV